jgi:putative RecB family exonuclease
VQKAFSHSSLSTFENCPRQYWFRYVEKVVVDVESVEAFVGKRVHEVLERLYLFVGEGMVPSLQRVLWRYRQVWDAQYDPARVRVVRSGYQATFYRDLGARCLENYYRRHYPFDADETLGLERPVRMLLDEAGRYAVRGIVDRVVRARDGALEIHDFKTGRRVPRQQELDRDRQLALYELALRAELGETGEVRLVWHYVQADRMLTSSRTPEQLDELRREVMALVDRIRAERGFEARPGPLCDWCEYRAMCPAFGGRPAVPAAPGTATAAEPDLEDPLAEAAVEAQLELL